MIGKILASHSRHALTFGGGALIAGGYADAETVQAAVGAATTLIGIMWSVFEKQSRF